MIMISAFTATSSASNTLRPLRFTVSRTGFVFFFLKTFLNSSSTVPAKSGFAANASTPAALASSSIYGMYLYNLIIAFDQIIGKRPAVYTFSDP